MSDTELGSIAPERLLDGADRGLGQSLLRSCSADAPPRGALERALIISSAALSGAAVATSTAVTAASAAGSASALNGTVVGSSAATTTTAVAASAGTAGAGAALTTGGLLGKSIIAWTLGGCLLGSVASGTALEVSTQGRWRKPAVASVSAPPKSALATSARTKVSDHAGVSAGLRDTRDAMPVEAVASEPPPAYVAPRPATLAARPPASHLAPEQASLSPPEQPQPASVPSGAGAAFSEELAIIDAARGRLRAGDAARALDLVRTYQLAFPRGQLLPEALAVSVEAALRAGRPAQARALAQRFFAAYPKHPLVARVRALLDEP